jgi:hypothetical protein
LRTFAVPVGFCRRVRCQLADGALPTAKRRDRSRPGAGRSKCLISSIVLRARPATGSKQDKRALNLFAAHAMQRVAFTGLIPHHPRETHFLSAGHASHRTCSSQIVNTHRTPCMLLAQDGLQKWLRTCGCVATLGPPKKRRRARECRRARFRKTGPDGFGYWRTGDRTGPSRKRQNCLGPTPAIAPATSAAALSLPVKR